MPADESPLAAHAASPAELQERLSAERAGTPFLVLRDGEGRQRLLRLDGQRLSVGRAESNGVALPWTPRSAGCTPSSSASRASGRLSTTASAATAPTSTAPGSPAARGCATATRCASDAPRSATAVRTPRRPSSAPSSPASPLALADLPATQRQVLVALARPYKQAEFATPATNQEIAAELHLSVDAVKAHLRSLLSEVRHRVAAAEPEALAPRRRGIPARDADAARPITSRSRCGRSSCSRGS